MSLKEWILAVVGTILVGVLCAWIDDHDRKILTLPEIQVHGHSSTN
jgi:hypothetical protein